MRLLPYGNGALNPVGQAVDTHRQGLLHGGLRPVTDTDAAAEAFRPMLEGIHGYGAVAIVQLVYNFARSLGMPVEELAGMYDQDWVAGSTVWDQPQSSGET